MRYPCRGVSRRNVNRFRGGLVFKAHRFVYRPTLGLSVIKKKKLVVDNKNSVSPSRLPGASETAAHIQSTAGPPNHLDEKVDSDQ